jgi:hypothetical protein
MKSYYDAKFGAQHADNQERDRCACRARTVVYCPQKAYLNAIGDTILDSPGRLAAGASSRPTVTWRFCRWL